MSFAPFYSPPCPSRSSIGSTDGEFSVEKRKWQHLSARSNVNQLADRLHKVSTRTGDVWFTKSKARELSSYAVDLVNHTSYDHRERETVFKPQSVYPSLYWLQTS